MSSELVRTDTLQPAIRTAAVLSDLAQIGALARQQAAVDEYAQVTMRTAIVESLSVVQNNPLIQRLGAIQTALGLDKLALEPDPTQEPVSLNKGVATSIKNPAAVQHALDVKQTIRDTTRKMHFDTTNPSAAQAISFSKLLQARGKETEATPEFLQATAIALTESPDTNSSPTTLELDRYRAWLGLQNGQVTKFTDTAAVDREASKQLETARSAATLTVFAAGISTATVLLGLTPYTKHGPLIVGFAGELIVGNINTGSSALTKVNPSMYPQIGRDEQINEGLGKLVTALEIVNDSYQECADFRRTMLPSESWWRVATSRVGDDIADVTWRIEQIKSARMINTLGKLSLQSTLQENKIGPNLQNYQTPKRFNFDTYISNQY